MPIIPHQHATSTLPPSHFHPPSHFQGVLSSCATCPPTVSLPTPQGCPPPPQLHLPPNPSLCPHPTVARTTSWNTWSSSSQGGREGKNIGTAEKRVALKSAPFFWARGKDDQAGPARQGGWSWGTLACTKTAILNGLVVHTPALL